MFQLMLTVVPLGIAAAFTPMLLGLQILIVSRPPPWGRQALAFGLGGATAFALVGGFFLSGLASLRPFLELRELAAAWTTAGLRLVIGAGLLLGSVYFLRSRPIEQAKAEAGMQRYLQDGSLRVFFLVAFALSIKDVSSFAVLVPALHDIVFSGLGWVRQTAALLVLAALALLPLWVPPVLARYAGQRGQRVLHAMYAFTMRHQLQLVGAMMVAAGIFLLASGWHAAGGIIRP
jgi:hypothetical protein